MPPLDVAGTTPVLVVGEGEQVQGEVWLSNPTGADIAVSAASITVTLPSGAESGPIRLPPDASVPANASRRLVIGMGMQPLTPPGSYAASLDLTTSAGPQSIAAQVVVSAAFTPQLVPQRLVFGGVGPGMTIPGSVVVLNRGNVAVPVGPIADEPLLEVRAHPRVFAVASGGAVSVEPAIGLAPAGVATFTNTQPTVLPGSWAAVDFQLTAPAALAANAHFRVLPRIATERFAVDLLTVP